MHAVSWQYQQEAYPLQKVFQDWQEPEDNYSGYFSD